MANQAAVREVAREGGVVRRAPAARTTAKVAAPRTIAQAALQEIAEKELELKGVEARAKELKQELEGARLGVLHLIRKGLPVEDGAYDALVKVVKGRRTPSWKDEFAALAGPEAVEEVIERTVPSEDRETVEVVRRPEL